MGSKCRLHRKANRESIVSADDRYDIFIFFHIKMKISNLKIKTPNFDLFSLRRWTDSLGRKRPMIFVNIPFAIGWFMLYRATAFWQVCFAFVMFGLAIGFMQSSVANYVGEIWFEPFSSFKSKSITLKIIQIDQLSLKHRNKLFD